jgi:CO dehydrogenase maturation factor
VATIEPYYRSMEVASRVASLASEMGIGAIWAVANKVRDAEDSKSIADFCGAHSLKLMGEIPYDPLLVQAERAGRTPLDYSPTGPAVRAIVTLADRLENADISDRELRS